MNYLQKFIVSGLKEKNNYAETKCMVDLIISYRQYKNERDAIAAGVYVKNPNNLNHAFETACSISNRPLINEYLQQGANYFYGMLGAVKGGHMKLFKFFVDGVEKNQLYSQIRCKLIYRAARYGHKHFLDYFEQELEKFHQNIIEKISYHLAAGGHLELLKLYGARPKFLNYTEVLLGAIKLSQFSILDYLIITMKQLTDVPPLDAFQQEKKQIDTLYNLALTSGKADVVAYLNRKFGDIYQFNLSHHKNILSNIVSMPDQIFQFLIDAGCIQWTEMMVASARGGNLRKIKYLYDEKKVAWPKINHIVINQHCDNEILQSMLVRNQGVHHNTRERIMYDSLISEAIESSNWSLIEYTLNLYYKDSCVSEWQHRDVFKVVLLSGDFKILQQFLTHPMSKHLHKCFSSVIRHQEDDPMNHPHLTKYVFKYLSDSVVSRQVEGRVLTD
jgi:hypothetical protein